MTAPATAPDSDIRIEYGSRLTRILLVIGLVLVVVAVTLPAWGATAAMRFLTEALVFVALAEMWNLLAGFAGLVSIGQQAFIGLGAYSLFVLSDLIHLPPVAPVFVTALAGGLVAAAIAPFVFRLGGGYFAIGTWVIAEVFRLVIVQFRALGAGTGTSVQSLIGMPAGDRQNLTFILALGLALGSIVAVTFLMRSRLGLALMAVRDSEVAAASLGVDVARAKRVVWVIAAAFSAAAGAVFYMQALRIQPPAAFGIDWTAKVIFIVVIGGVGRIEGPLIGTAIFFVLQSTLASLGALYLVILGAVAVLVTVFAPQGVWGAVTARFPLSVFPIHRRVRTSEPAAPGGGPT